MAECIEWEALLAHLRKCKETSTGSGLTAAVITAIQSFVEGMPLADVAPVVHGGAVLRETVGLLEKQERQIQTLKAYEDTRLSSEKVSWMKEVVEAAFDNDTSRIERAHNLHVADKEGRVVVLPCKVGDKLYRVFAGEIFEHRVGRMKYFAIQGRWDIETYPFCSCVESSIGKTVFLSRKEAEKALAEMEGKKDG